MKFVSLHHHTTYSYGDGFGLPEAHAARAAELGMSALAVTDHGNVSAHIKHEQACTKHGVKPIFGLEAYVGPKDMRETGNMRKWHQTILAMNQEGYINLMQMVSRSWDEGFYRWPTVSSEMLKTHNEGLIVTSGCADSHLACTLLGGKGREVGDYDEAIKVMLWYKKVFGDRYYLEVQRFPELERTCILNARYAQWSKDYGIPLVATADAHYPHPEDNEMQKILHAASRNTGTVAAAEAGWEYDIKLTFPLSDDEVLRQLVETGLPYYQAEQALDNTAWIAEHCTVELPKMDRVRFPLPKGMETSEELFRNWLNRGWKFRGFDKLPRKTRKQYRERVEYETGLMADKDFLDYFLMLSDAVRATKNAGVPVGPARGSAAASLVCYLLRITEVNPMEYPLMLFERFIDPNRMDLPDVDLDFDDELRDFVRQHMIKRYGAERVGNIGTFTRYRGKNAIDDVARVYSLPKFEIDRAKEFLVERSGGDSRFDASIEDTIDMFPQVKEVFDRYPDLYKSLRLEGNYKGFGVHAAGVVVGAAPLTDYLAAYTKHNVGRQKNTLSVMSADKYDGEHIGLMKLDALGLTTVGMIRHALEIIGMTLDDLYAVPMDDPETLAAFERADVVGIFQFEGRTMRMVTQEMKPKTFMDLAAVNALSRPGPLHSGSTGDYLAVRHGRQEIEELHPVISELCATTEGQIIYQEQILQICRTIGQFPWVHASTIRKVISQKKGEAAFNSLWEDFKRGAMSQGISEEVALKIWKRMVTAGTYAFNIAHCVSYSMLGFWTMWLKVHHPEAFYTAQLRKASTDPKKRKDLALMRDMQDRRFGRSLKVYPPNLNKSAATWMPRGDGSGVVAGYNQIAGIGEKTAAAILAAREEMGEFEDWDDLRAVKGVGTKTIEKIRTFVELDDPFGIDWIKNSIRDIRAEIRKDGMQGQCPMPNTLAENIPYDAKRSFHVILGVVRAKNLQDLYENHRSRTGEDLDPETVNDPELKDSMTLYMEDTSGLMTVKIDRWRYPELKEQLWDIRIGQDFVLAKVRKSPFYGKTVKVQSLWVIDPES